MSNLEIVSAIFITMQYNSNLRTRMPKENVLNQASGVPPENETSAKKIILLLGLYT